MLEGLERGGKWLIYVCRGLSRLPCREDHRGVSGSSLACVELNKEGTVGKEEAVRMARL